MKYTSIVLIILLTASALALQGFVKDPAYDALDTNRKGIERVTNFDPRIQTHRYTWNALVYLEPKAPPFISTGFSTLYPRGTAQVYSARYGKDISSGLKLDIHELKPSRTQDYVFESWLVDDDTGYWLSTGLFNTKGRGTALVRLQELNLYLDIYDKVVITREPFPDNNPSPSNEIALEGNIKRRTPLPYEPNASVYNRLWGVNDFFRPNMGTGE